MKITTTDLFKLQITGAPRRVLHDITEELLDFRTDRDAGERQAASKARHGGFDYVGFYHRADFMAVMQVVEKVALDHDIAGNINAPVEWQSDTTKRNLKLSGFTLAPGETIADFEPDPFKCVTFLAKKAKAELMLNTNTQPAGAGLQPGARAAGEPAMVIEAVELHTISVVENRDAGFVVASRDIIDDGKQSDPVEYTHLPWGKVTQ